MPGVARLSVSPAKKQQWRNTRRMLRVSCDRCLRPPMGDIQPGQLGLASSDERWETCVASLDSFGAKSQLQVGEESFEIFRLDALGELNLPYTHRVLLENLLRTEDGANVTAEQIRSLAAWDASAAPSQ